MYGGDHCCFRELAVVLVETVDLTLLCVFWVRALGPTNSDLKSTAKDPNVHDTSQMRLDSICRKQAQTPGRAPLLKIHRAERIYC
ncbi:hypothetical protein GOODEAATRI_005356 [Goodea atripinnis]|uniref:Secreted protein n=1 Tax=Goodea atripinnis TaxID=208336 RepID=A0ABV0NHP2_9TELE